MRHPLRAWILAALASCWVFVAPSARAILLDPTFGTGGTAVDSFGIDDIVVEPGTGRIIALTFPWLSAFLPDGTKDPSFDISESFDAIHDCVLGGPFVLARQPSDGKLLVGIWGCGIKRFDTDGHLDPSFTEGGGMGQAKAILVQPDGKIVTTDGPTTIVRLLADGTLDAGFGSGGSVGTAENVQAIALDANGKIVAVTGTFGTTDPTVVRYLTDGSLDPTFGSGGPVTIHIEGMPYVLVREVLHQADDKLIAIGLVGPCGDPSSGLMAARFLPDGTIDPSYGSGGVAVVPYGFLCGGIRAALDGAGGVVALGDRVIGRLTPDGVLDRDFAPCGVTALPFPISFAVGSAIALQPDGKILVGGYSLVRYESGVPTCQPAGARRSTIVVRPNRSHPETARVRWKWRSSAPVSLADFGDRVLYANPYFACVVDAGAGAGRVASHAFQLDPYFEASPSGYKFKVEPFSIRLHPGGSGRASIFLGDDASQLIASSPYVAPLTVRLDRAGTPFCWEATFSTLRTNSPIAFKATSD